MCIPFFMGFLLSGSWSPPAVHMSGLALRVYLSNSFRYGNRNMRDPFGCSQCAWRLHRCWCRKITKHRATWLSMSFLSDWILSHSSSDFWLFKNDHLDHGLQVGLTQTCFGRWRQMIPNSLLLPSAFCRLPWFRPKRMALPPRWFT